MSRRLNFMPSRYAGSADVGNPASVSRAPVAGRVRTRRSGEIFHADYRARQLLEGLGLLRIAGRHSAAPVGISMLDRFLKEFGVPVDQGRAAFAAGQQDRARGVRCMCPRCNGQQLTRETRLDP